MKKLVPFVVLIAIAALSCTQKPASHDRLANSSRSSKNGWIYVHLQGSPADIGYQHGYLLAPEIDTLIKAMKYYLPTSSKRNWDFYRQASARFLWKKVDPEYQTEIKGIAEGLQAKGM